MVAIISNSCWIVTSKIKICNLIPQRFMLFNTSLRRHIPKCIHALIMDANVQKTFSISPYYCCGYVRKMHAELSMFTVSLNLFISFILRDKRWIKNISHEDIRITFYISRDWWYSSWNYMRRWLEFPCISFTVMSKVVNMRLTMNKTPLTKILK